MKFPRLLAAAWATLAVFSAGCSRRAAAPAAGAAPALLPVTFQLDWYPTAEHGGYFEALARGYYRDAGLEVTIASGGPNSLALQAVGTASTAFAMGRCDDLIVAASRGIPLVAVGVQMQHDPQAILLHADSPVKSFPDLNGRSVMAGLGSHWVDFIEQHYHIGLKIIPSDYGMSRFLADPAFIQQCFVTSEPYFAEKHGVKVRTLLIASGGYDGYRVVYTSRRFAAAHPAAVRAFLAASRRGWAEYLQGDPAPAFALIAARNPTQDRGLMEYSLAALKRWHLVEGDPARGESLGQMTPARLRTLVDQLVEIGALPAPVPIDSFASFAFVPPAATYATGK